jgi:hypothetical protein
MMPDTGETAPTFTATVGTSDHEPFGPLSDMSRDAVDPHDEILGTL